VTWNGEDKRQKKSEFQRPDREAALWWVLVVMAAASPYLGQRGRLLHLRRGDVVPGAPELAEHEGVEVPAVLRQAALAEQDSSQV